MVHYEEHFCKIIDFLNLYQQLIDCHLVDFISHKLWDKCLPELLKLELENIQTMNDIWKENENVSRLNEFIRMTKSLSLQSCSMISNYKDIPEFLNLNLDNDEFNVETNNKDAEFMSEKKFHEVETLGRVIGHIAKSTKSLVIDAGAGKAYLSTYLSENYKLPVLAIDSSDLCHKGAVHRTEKMKKVGKQSSSSVKYIVAKIDENTDYNKMVNLNFPNWNLKNNLILTGLHTCGSLAHSLMKVFLHNDNFKVICFVPCCYHLVSESFSKRIKFSRNARMLAQQCIERTKKTKSLSPSLFYRALLQVLLHSMGLDNVKIGRGGPLSDFPTYAKWALLKIGIDIKKIPPNEILEQLYQSHINLKLKLNLFQMLRIYISPVLEAAIILDRIVYLQNSMKCSKSFILRLFNPVLSPRQYAIVSVR
ncbi:PREDICTED: methyltransferase-like protein 25 isoform X1 [Polistes canadensis]|uniref:methyltransferase-like protein 25 isoform X1 n=3 Tax=Polistes canadensis TaxID=91411 RepID=UPI000718CABD|nr:PREDICTED: methyltransferase-like protein 25 isoform X1 [Polistes canadensis]